MKWAFLVVDLQKDFCEGGELAAADTTSLLNPLHYFIERVRRLGILVVFTQDWHPSNHNSFITNGGRWPVHCVAGSPGANLEAPLTIEPTDLVIRKGQVSGEEGYSAFESNDLAQQLRSRNIEALAIAGIATDFCVHATALDAAHCGFKTHVLVDLTRAVYPETVRQQLAEMEKAGVHLTQSQDWLQAFEASVNSSW